MAQRGITNSISGKLLAVIAACVVVFAVVMGSYLMYFRSQLVAGRSAALAKQHQGEVDTLIKGKMDILLTNAISIAHNARVIEALQKNDYTIAEKELKQICKEFETADFKGTGFHIVRANMTSFWRSFMEKKDDDVSFREMIKKIVAGEKAALGGGDRQDRGRVTCHGAD